MKVRCIFNSRLAAALNVLAITLYPFIFFSGSRADMEAQNVVAHEYIHVLQIRKLGWLRFYWTYLVQYFGALLRGASTDDAYMGVSYEKEAYAGEKTQVVPPGFDA